MFKKYIYQSQKDYAWSVVKKHNIANRGKHDGSQRNQYVGILGEVIVADMNDAPRPTGEGGFDKGIDFTIYGVKCDLKTMERKYDPKPHWVNNYYASQFKYETEVFVFASINSLDSTITFCGVLGKWELGEPYKEGTVRTRDDGSQFTLNGDSYEVPMKQLHDVDSFSDMMTMVHRVYVGKPKIAV